jgi:hypothetical protein
MANQGVGYRVAWAGLLVGAVLQAACASMCEELAADRKAFFARRPPAASEPHATVLVPFAVADRLIERRLRALQPVGSPVILPGRIGKFLGSVRLVPRRLTMRPAPDDRVGLRLEVDVMAGEKSLLALSMDLDVRPEVDAGKGRLRVALRADDVRKVRPSLHPDAAQGLAAEIRSRLPSVARAVVSQDEIAALARGSIDYLAGHLGSLLVDSGLIGSLGEVTDVTVDIPVVPVSRLSLHSVRQGGGGLLIGVFTDLPAPTGVPTSGVRVSDPEVVQVRLSADALAELGNRALTSGRLPRRYDEQMRPKKDGDFTPGLRWVAGPRPFKIFAWRVKSPCLRARIGADPTVTVSGGRLAVGIEHGEVEEVRGAALVRARVWMKRIGADAIRFTRHTIASARVSIAGTPLGGRIQRAAYRDGIFAVDLVVNE